MPPYRWVQYAGAGGAVRMRSRCVVIHDVWAQARLGQSNGYKWKYKWKYNTFVFKYLIIQLADIDPQNRKLHIFNARAHEVSMYFLSCTKKFNYRLVYCLP